MDLWTEILSRQVERIRLAFQSLTTAEKISVRAHLIRMTTEDGWHDAQVESALAALDAIKDLADT
ncbi:MAG: hypothetical protein PVI99_08220 [Anaerolineales bacterium]|jgi:hypothetical protein